MLWSNFWKWLHSSTRRALPQTDCSNQEEGYNPWFYFCFPYELKIAWHDIHRWLTERKDSVDEKTLSKERIVFLRFALEAIKEDLQSELFYKIRMGIPLGGRHVEPQYWFPIRPFCDILEQKKRIPVDGNTVFVIPNEKGSRKDATHESEKRIYVAPKTVDGSYFPALHLILLTNVHHVNLAKLPGSQIQCEMLDLASSYSKVKIIDSHDWSFPDGRNIPIFDPRFAMLYLLSKELCIGIEKGEQLALENPKGMLSEEELPSAYINFSKKLVETFQE